MECTFHPDSNATGKYSCSNSLVSGKIKLSFKKGIKLYSIEYGLKGIAECSSNVTRYSRRRQFITETSDIFVISKDLLSESSSNVQLEESSGLWTVKQGESITADVHVEFPIDASFLPSSCSDFGTYWIDTALITVKYYLYVTVSKHRSVRKSASTEKFSFPLIFQGGNSEPLAIDRRYFYTQQKIFDKVKQLAFDESLKALVPTGLKNSHGKTRFIRQLWDSNYQLKNYNSVAKSIPVKVKMEMKSSIHLNEPFFKQILTVISFDLSNFENGPHSNDFLFNGQSTKLGLFSILSLKVFLRSKVRIVVRGNINEIVIEEPIHIFDYKKSPIEFDLKDLKYDTSKKVCKFNVPIASLETCLNGDLSLHDIIGKNTVMCNSSSNYFICSSFCDFEWEFGNGTKRESILVHTNATPNLQLADAAPLYDYSHPDLPPYSA